MRSRALVAVVVGCALGFAIPAGSAMAASGPYVVVYKDTVTDPAALTSSLQSSLGIKPTFRYLSAIGGFAAVLTDTQRTTLAANPSVEYVVSDIAVKGEGLVPLSSGETVPPGIRRIGAANLTQAHAAAGGAVAVLDTGIDLNNADLNAVSGTNCITAGTAAQDDYGHGTNVAGILAARNSGSVVTGVAPGTKLYAVKVLNNRNTGTLSQILCGIDWVTANAATLGIRVANMSVSGAGANDGNCGNTNNDAWHKAICRSVAAGVTYVVSAGNSKTSYAGTIPAAYPEVLTVTAMSDTDGLAGAKGAAPSCKSGEKDDTYGTYSNYAPDTATAAHTIAGPGTCVVSDKLRGGTSTYYGTSQATPHVAGALALCFDDGGVAGPCAGMTPAQAIAKVRADAAGAATTANGFSGDPLRPVSGRYYGYLVTAAGY